MHNTTLQHSTVRTCMYRVMIRSIENCVQYIGCTTVQIPVHSLYLNFFFLHACNCTYSGVLDPAFVSLGNINGKGTSCIACPQYTYGTRQKKVSGLSQYLPVLPQYFCRYFRGYFYWYLLYSTIEAHNAREEVFHKKRTAVHTQLTSGFVDRCLYCRRATYQASVLLRFTHRQCCTDRTRQRS